MAVFSEPTAVMSTRSSVDGPRMSLSRKLWARLLDTHRYTDVEYESKKRFRSVTQNGKVIPGRAVPFRSATIRRCRKQLAGRFAAVLIASSSAKPTRLSAWSLPVVIFTRQRQALTTSFSLTRRQRGQQSSSRVTGSTEEQTERNV